MLVIRAEQVKVFEQAALRRFEDEMVVHSKEFTPRLCEVLGDEQLRAALRQAMQRATHYGFTNRGPMRFYIELRFLFGSHFDTDPQYPAMSEVLNASGDQMTRADQIYEGVVDYHAKVAGENNVNVRKSLEALSVFARKPVSFSSHDFVTEMLQHMTRIFPQKSAYVGKEALTKLIHEGRTEAQKYGFTTPHAEALIVVLMFAFGHGCTDDPLYPWISRTLNDEKIIDPATRAERLEKQAVTWFDHELAKFQKGEQI